MTAASVSATPQTIAIIPARGGSKRIPRKTILAFSERTMIAWPMQTALESKCFDREVGSTEDPEIPSPAQRWRD
jgi:N-acylneuraminate cytidylyltransferase